MSGTGEARGTKPRVGFMFLDTNADWHGGLNYFRALFLALQSLPDSSVQPVAFFRTRADAVAHGFSPNVETVVDSTFVRRSVKRVLTRLAMRLGGVQSFPSRVALRHGVKALSHGGLSQTPRLKTIGWIPDFQHLHLPQFFSKEELEARDRHYRDLLEGCDLLIVSSETARDDLRRFAPRHADKARVLRFAAIRPDIDAFVTADVVRTHGIDTPYFYLPNQAWAHKNHLTAVRALAMVKADVKIVCSGALSDYRNPGHLEELRRAISESGLENRFLMLGLIPYGHIAQLMLGSVAVINPSLFEGWSTTVEEAKALGVPMILSGIAVHREQCSQGEATFFEPTDAQALAERMKEALEAWDGAAIPDPRAALALHQARVNEFGRAYERIVAELQISGAAGR